MPSHNLIDEAWLPVNVAGKPDLVGIKWALVNSHRVQQLAVRPATAWVAVLRQALLPLIADAFGFPATVEDWAERHDKGQFDADTLDAYLDEHRSRFNVFDEFAPFAQVANLRTSRDELKSSSLLLPSVPSGNNVPLFGSRTDAQPPVLSWGEAVIGLLTVQCWDIAGIKTGAVGDPQAKDGKTTANPIGPLGALGIIVPTGPTLFETLMLNLPIVEEAVSTLSRRPDLPQWRRKPPDASWNERAVDGYRDSWTFQARRVRLVPSVNPSTGETVVTKVLVTAGDRLRLNPDWEPHSAWRSDKKVGGRRVPIRHSSGRAAWRGLDPLIAADSPSREDGTGPSRLLRQIAQLQADDFLPPNYPLGIVTAGVEYGNMQAIVNNVIADEIPLPIAALRVGTPTASVIDTLVRDTDELIKAIDELERNVRIATGSNMPDWGKGQRASDRLVFRLDDIARRVLIGLQREPDRADEARNAWRTAARAAGLTTADELLSSLPLAALVGRKKNDHLYRASNAEAIFQSRLRRALPMEPDDTDASADQEGERSD